MGALDNYEDQLNRVKHSLRDILEALEAAITTAGIEDGSLTNAKLGSDIKVGSLASLTTTVKTSVQGAINELDAEIGTLSSLTTTAKNTVVAALNEINALIGTADTEIGNLATLTTTAKSSLVAAINELDTDNALMVTTTGTQTLTNKSLTSPVLTTPKVADGDLGVTITSADQTNAAPVVTIPDIADAADTFVMEDVTQTLTNKTLTAPIITAPAITYNSSDINFAGGHADYTLSATEIKTLFLDVTNADQAANILAPATKDKVFCVVNGSGFAITLLVSGQTGITVANGKSAFLRCDGTDYIRVTPDA